MHEDSSYSWRAVRQNHRGTEFTETWNLSYYSTWKNCIFLLLSNGRLRRSSSVRSVTLWFYSRKPPGLISQLRLLTTEAQRREIHLIAALEKGLHNCFLAIVVSVRSSSVRSVTPRFYYATDSFFMATIINRRDAEVAETWNSSLLQYLKRIAYLLLSNGRLRRSSSVRSATLRFYSRKPSVFKLSSPILTGIALHSSPDRNRWRAWRHWRPGDRQIDFGRYGLRQVAIIEDGST